MSVFWMGGCLLLVFDFVCFSCLFLALCVFFKHMSNYVCTSVFVFFFLCVLV